MLFFVRFAFRLVYKSLFSADPVDQLVRVVSRSLAEGRPDGGRASRVRACASLSPPLSCGRACVCLVAGDGKASSRGRAVAERKQILLTYGYVRGRYGP